MVNEISERLALDARVSNALANTRDTRFVGRGVSHHEFCVKTQRMSRLISILPNSFNHTHGCKMEAFHTDDQDDFSLCPSPLMNMHILPAAANGQEVKNESRGLPGERNANRQPAPFQTER